MKASRRPILIFSVDDQRFGIGTTSVQRVERMVDVTPLPSAPHPVRGVIDVGGQVVPVFDIRRCFGWEERDFRPEDFLVLVRVRDRSVAVIAEKIMDVEDGTEDRAGAEAAGAYARPVAGVLRTGEGLILIQDPDRFFSAEDWEQLTGALRRLRETEV